MKIVLNSGTNEHVAIGGNFHLAFAHPCLAISFISSIVNFGARRCARQPRKSVMAPSCATALTTIRPSGNLSASIFSPGLTPRCLRRSCFNVTCPLAVMVRTVILPPEPVQCKAILPYCQAYKPGRHGILGMELEDID